MGMIKIFYKLNILECLMIFGFPLILSISTNLSGYPRIALLVITLVVASLMIHGVIKLYKLLSTCILRNMKLNRDQEFSVKINLIRGIAILVAMFAMYRLFGMYQTGNIVYWETSVYIILICIFNLRVMTRLHYSLSRRKRKYVL